MPRYDRYGGGGWGSEPGFIPSGEQGHRDAAGVWHNQINNGGVGSGSGGVGGFGAENLPSTALPNATTTTAGTVPVGTSAAGVAGMFGIDDAVMAGISLLNGVLSRHGQPRPNSFSRGANSTTDPVHQLSGGLDKTNELWDMMKGQLSKGITLPSSYVQQPNSVGGFGLSGRDPALANPSLLSLPGIQLGAPPRQASAPDTTSRNVPPGMPEDGKRDPRQPLPTNPRNPNKGGEGGEASSSQQALAAFKLLGYKG